MEKQYFTIVDKNTGQELRGQFKGAFINENENEIEEKRTEPMENPYFDFETREFYDNI